jgi:hypothetical protein
MKRCPMCKVMLPSEAFAKRTAKSKPSSYCRQCQRIYCRAHYLRNAALHKSRRMANTKRYRQRNREVMIRYLNHHPCVTCGNDDILVLDFDHAPGTKAADVSILVSRGASWERIEREMAKCVVRCANCHRRKTAIDFGWYKGKGIGA